MNKFSNKSFAIAAVTLLAAMPFASQAHNYDAAMDSCISAFVSANLPKEQPVKVRKEETANSPLNIHSRGYKIVVSAKGVESGKYLARGTCTVDRSGAVIALNGKPLSTKLAAR
jgi:hypothetical protein